MPPTLEELTTLARGAGEILRSGYGKPHDIHHKGPTDLVTEMDARSEAFLLSYIKEHHPQDTIESEEAGTLDGDAGMWFIDPLDGTTNYAHALPIFSVSVAWARGKDLKLGVVYDPMRDECFAAEAGRGAWLNGAPIHVSDTVDFIQSLLVTGFAYDETVRMQNLKNFENLLPRVQAIRRLGSAALDLCYVASGRFDGYWEIALGPWDMAAGALIVREAGGVVTTCQGDTELFQPPYGLVAAGPGLHPQILHVLQGS